jgi:hypothetical protein
MFSFSAMTAAAAERPGNRGAGAPKFWLEVVLLNYAVRFLRSWGRTDSKKEIQ